MRAVCRGSWRRKCQRWPPPLPAPAVSGASATAGHNAQPRTKSYDGVQQQPLSVYQDMALLALDLFARVKARRVDADPPFPCS